LVAAAAVAITRRICRLAAWWFVTLFGITLRNSIMMISHFEHLVNEEGMTWGRRLRSAALRAITPVL